MGRYRFVNTVFFDFLAMFRYHKTYFLPILTIPSKTSNIYVYFCLWDSDDLHCVIIGGIWEGRYTIVCDKEKKEKKKKIIGDRR